MSLQAILNNQAIEALKIVAPVLQKIENFHEWNQAYCYTLRALCDSRTCINDMAAQELSDFQNDLLETFKYKNWI